MGAGKYFIIENCLCQMSDKSGLSCVEVGTEHERRGDGSTRFLSAYCQREGIEFYTVDLDPVVATHGKTITPNAICARGEDFLTAYPSKNPIVFAYLDNFDWTYAGVEHVPKVIRQAEHYRNVHKVERTNANSQAAHLAQSRALFPLFHTMAFVVFDDTWVTPEGGYDGKGGTAVPFLLENGLVIVSQGDTTDPHVLLRKG